MTGEIQAVLWALQSGEQASITRTVNGTPRIRRFLPPARLILLGAGHVARSLCRMAALLEYSVTVIDDRPEYADVAFFPDAACVRCEDFDAAIASLRLTQQDAVCIVARGHRESDACLRAVLRGRMPGYLGLLSVRRHLDGLLPQLRREGFPEEKLARLHAPMGLPIGARTSAEIAVSVCAELVQTHRSPAQTQDGAVLERQDAALPVLTALAGTESPRVMLLVLESEGVTPVQSGAIMALTGEGRCVGTVGGGYAEAAALARARELCGSGGCDLLRVALNPGSAQNLGWLTVYLEDIQ